MKGERTPRSEESNTSKGSNVRSNSQKRSKSENRSNSNRRKSRNSDNKAVHETLRLVRRKVKDFKKRHLGGKAKFDFAACSGCLKQILEGWGMQPGDIQDYDDFLQLTLRREIDEEIADTDDFIDLNVLSKRAQDFEILVPDAKRRLASCLDKNVEKSCTSLKEIAEDELLVAVSDYDKSVQQHRDALQAKREELQENYAEYKKLLEPFPVFVEKGDQHTSLMNTVCNNILEMCKILEDWVKEDDEYPEKLLEEFNDYKKKKENLKRSIKENEDKKEENKQEIQKLRRSEAKAGFHYSAHKQDKDKLKNRQDQLQRKKQMVMDKLEKKRDERDKMREEREQNPMSPRESDRFLERLEEMEADIAKLEREQKTTDKQLRRVEKDMKPTRDRTYEHKVDAVTHRHKREELQKENRKLDEDKLEILEQMFKINERMMILMKIREMKLSPEAHRKGIRDKQKKDASQSDGTQQFMEACSYASPSIGKNWSAVYVKLPFDPPRDVDKLRHDVDVMDKIAARNDVTDGEQALKSLQKWRSFHRHANLSELIDTLRIVKLRQIAHDVEEKYGGGAY